MSEIGKKFSKPTAIMAKLSVKIAFMIILGLLVASCEASRFQKTNLTLSPSPELVDLLINYFKADSEKSSQFQPQLLKHSTSELAAAIPLALDKIAKNGFPTGVLPSQKIEVAGNAYSYALYVPPSYHPDKAYPLVLCLHGAGFSGDSYLSRWQPRLGESYLLACPSIEGGEFWTKEGEDLVLSTLAKVTHDYHVDPNRVFLTGMSNGAIGAYMIGLNYSDRFAALVPMAGALDEELFPLLNNAKNLPVYIIHGKNDEVMPVSFAREIADYLKTSGYYFVYREHDRIHPIAGGHFFPKEELSALMDWISDKKRNPEPKELVIVRDRNHIGRAYWVRIDKISDVVGSFWPSENDPTGISRLKKGAYARLSAKIEKNVISVTSQNIEQYTLLLNPTLIDLNKPVEVKNNGKTLFSGLVAPDSLVLLREARDRLDADDLVYCELKIRIGS